jgi:hypothetical protein
MGLNHMNGRVEDAILGRVLSPDSHIPDPTNAQSYNRYSYVNNNPVTMIDPSGFNPDHNCDFYLSWCGRDFFHGSGMGNGEIGVTNFETDGIEAFSDLINQENGDSLSAYSDALTSSLDSLASNIGTDGGSSTAGSSGTDASAEAGGTAQSQTPIDMSPSADGLAPVVVTAQGDGQGQGPDISTAPSVDGIPAIIVTAMQTRPYAITMSTWSYSKIATQHLWFPFSNTSQFLPSYNGYAKLYGLAGTIWGRGASNGYFASNGMFVAYANVGQPVGTDQSGNLTNYGTIVVLPNPDWPGEGEVISMYPGQPGNIPQY